MNKIFRFAVLEMRDKNLIERKGNNCANYQFMSTLLKIYIYNILVQLHIVKYVVALIL